MYIYIFSPLHVLHIFFVKEALFAMPRRELKLNDARIQLPKTWNSFHESKYNVANKKNIQNHLPVL